MNAASDPRGATQTTHTETGLVFTRTFDAPRELVWKAWTDPAHAPKWWGPNGFTTTSRSMDVRPGGVWSFVMHGPDGRDYANHVMYLEVLPNERLVYKHGGGEDTEPVNFQVQVMFEKAGPEGRGTKLTMRMDFPSKSAKEFVLREYGAEQGGHQHVARLEAYLQNIDGREAPSGGHPATPFVISRVFPFARSRVYEVWTQREHLAAWFGPKGASIVKCELDLRPDGTFLYGLGMPDGKVMWGKWVFREIVPSQRLVFVTSFSDENGGTTRHPLSPTWPRELLSIVTFSDHAGIGGGTVVTVQWSPINASEQEIQTFNAGRDSMKQGWGGTMDVLGEFLARSSSETVKA